MAPHSVFLSAAVLAGLWLAGCATPPPGPLHTPPPDPALTDGAPAGDAVGRPLPRDWWTAFGDPELDVLVTRALAGNRDLVQAAARLDAAQARARLAGAEAAVQVTGSGGAGRQRNSETTATAFGPTQMNRFNLGLQFAWEADLWGRVRASREAALRTVDLTTAEQAAAGIAVAAEVAKAHLNRLATRREAAVLDRHLAAYADTEVLQSARAAAGFATDLDVERVRIERAAREGERSLLGERERALAHALALLCGESAGAAPAVPRALAEAVVPEVPRTLALPLLESRPDVAAKRAKWEASVQRVRGARAALYPTLRLSGTVGAESADSGDLLDWQSRLWSLVAGLTAPVLDGGRLRASLEIERAALREAAAGYEAAVLTAYREVADALNVLDGAAARQQAAERAREAASSALVLSRERYDKGFVTYLEVVDSERALLGAERTLVQLQAARQTATVDLIRALGIP